MSLRVLIGEKDHFKDGKIGWSVEEYLRERGISGRGVVEQARRECLDRKRWKLFSCGHSLGGVP